MAKITIEYCSSYDSYNGEKVTEGKVLAPVLISDAEFQSNNTIIPENLRTWKHYGVPFRVGFMVVNEADFNKMLSLYYSGINDYFEEHPELRPGRCVLGWDNEGFPILCSKENRCKGCPRRAEHLPRFKSREDFIQFTSFQDTHEDEDGNTLLSSDRLTPIELEPVMALNASHHLPQAVTATVQVILIISLVFVE